MTPTLRRLVLDGPGLVSAVTLTPGAPLLGAWVFDRAFSHHEGGVLLVFAEHGGRRTLGLQVRRRRDDAPAWRRTPRLDLISHVPADVDEGPVLAAFAEIVERLDGADRRAAEVIDPSADGPPVPAPRQLVLPPSWRSEAPSPFGFGRDFVLDLDSDCGLDCAFCSTRGKLSPRTRFDGREEARHAEALARGRAAGYDVLRVSGLDPLTHPAAIPLIARARGLGFAHVHVYTPGLRLADAAVLDALLAAVPADYTLHIPLYGATAATHDRLTGRPGAFDLVVRGLDGLKARDQLDHLLLLTVAMAGNLDDLPALRRLFATWAAPVQVFLPFPATRDPRDRFFEVAVRHEALVRALMACEPPMGLPELLPCVRFRHERDTGRPALSTGGLHPTTALLGTLFQHADYRRVHDGVRGNTFTIPVVACPHRDACALARVCPGVVYAAYSDAFGLDELAPVSGSELDELGVTLPEPPQAA